MRTVIVDRRYPEIFRSLALVLQQAGNTRLIWDRRHEPDRRRPADARRTLDRRARPTDSWMRHHWLVLDADQSAAS